MCIVYSPISHTFRSTLQQEISRSWNLEVELLPSTCATFSLRIKKKTFLPEKSALLFQSPTCGNQKKIVWNLKEDGNGNDYDLAQCAIPPPPKAVLESVKYGYKKTCTASSYWGKSIFNVQLSVMHGTVIGVPVPRKVN